MQGAILVALVVAVVSGIAIGTQSTLTNWGGRLVGPFNTGLLTNGLGGTVSVLVLLVLGSRATGLTWGSFKGVAVLLTASGIIGIGIISGIAFSLPRTGIAAGIPAIILGQMTVGIIVDTYGWGGLDPIPLKASRLVGLVLMVAATWFLLPPSAQG